MIIFKRIAILVALLALAGCANLQRTDFPPPEGPAEPAPPEPPSEPDREPELDRQPPSPPQQPPAEMPPRSAQEASSPAVLSLLGRAETLARGGHMEMAAATLERALDLEPRNPFIYQRLASVRLAQDQAGQAEAMARKSNSVAGNNPFVRADNWRLIAEARQSTGDGGGARDARARADEYRSASQQFGR